MYVGNGLRAVPECKILCHCQGACARGNLRRKVMHFVGEGLDPPLFPVLPLRMSVDSGGSVTLPYSRCVVLAGGSVTLPYGRRIFGRGSPLPYTAPRAGDATP